MLLKDLINGLDIVEIKGSTNLDITGVAYDSRKVTKGSVFVCIDGTVSDGHDYIPQALEKGAVAFVIQKDIELPERVCAIKTTNTRYALAFLSDAFFGHPSGKLNLIGVTGTKGKTTTTFMIKSILGYNGKKTGIVGSLGSWVGDREIHTDRTTPESYNLQELFANMVNEGIEYAAMEVSSQGLALHRVGCCDFNIGIFTNLSKDHIGPKEHSSIEDYLNAKIKLFEMCKKGIVNIDSEYASKVIKEANCDVVTFGIDNDADIRAYDIIKHPQSVEYRVKTPWFNGDIKVNIPGKFSVYNSLAAIGACGILGIPFEDIKAGLEKVQVPGRAEKIETGRDFSIILDFAHTPDSLDNILSTVKDYAKGRVVCLFGCGGDRDRTKRPMMGEISGRLADFTIVTSDNPRTENAEAIIDEIEVGIKKSGGSYIRITNRREAIGYAIKNARPDDVIILAGKGDETYQIIGKEKFHFDEREIARDVLNEIANN